MATREIAETLRTAREQQSITLAEMARRTKIPIHVLEAIECDCFDQVPGGLFTRGYLRAYAAELGLDGERIVENYVAESEPEVEPLERLRERFRSVEFLSQGGMRHLMGAVLLVCVLYS